MNFQDLKKIEKPDFYLDVAFRKASKKGPILKKKAKGRDTLQKKKIAQIGKMEIVKTALVDDLMNILRSFPEIDTIDIFYQELIKCTLDYASLKKSLGSLNWTVHKIESFFKIYKEKIKRVMEFQAILALENEYYGRISSVLKQMKPYLAYLEESRHTMRHYPAIKTSVYTVCLFGFPNVGKSTLLSKMTTAKPEIKDYPFTTKTLNLGYIKEPGMNVQVIDTPGTLNRVEKMNDIELQAYLALKFVSDSIVYVFDPTLEYEQEKQDKLLLRVKEFEKPVMLYMSKSDIAPKENIALLKSKYPDIITDISIIQKELVILAKQKKYPPMITEEMAKAELNKEKESHSDIVPRK